MDDLAAEIGRDGCVKRSELPLDRAAPLPANQVEAGVDEQLVQPAVEREGVAQRRQIAPTANERVLDRVSREVVVPDDQTGGGVQPRDGRAGQRGEGVMIAPLRSLR